MLADDIKDAIDKAVFEGLSKIGLRAGTVVTSPFENIGDMMTVQFDGSSVATPVKLIRSSPVFPGMRVGLACFGSEWTCVGAFDDPRASVQAGVNAAATTSPNNDDTTSASYVNMAGTGSVASFSFEKKFETTRIKVVMHASTFTLTSTSVASLAVNIDGIDYEIVRGASILSQHSTLSGTRYIPDVSIGTYTVQGRWLRSSGTGTLRRNFDDWLTITAEEVV